MTVEIKEYVFHSDPGHAWLEVETQELFELGIAYQITDYSYMTPDAKTAFLEEDCDASLFLKTKSAFNHRVRLKNKYYNQRCSIRTLPKYDFLLNRR